MGHFSQKYGFKSFAVILFYILICQVDSISTNCLVGCQQCVQVKSGCVSCRQDFELSNSRECINNTIPNCIKYENRLICSECRPTFRLINNRCIKMYDGCLVSGQLNLCSSCVESSFLDKSTSVCVLNQLNCQQLGRNRKCLKCKQNYRLDINKNVCILNSTTCAKTDQNTGLCMICAQNHTLIGFECFRTEKLSNLANCYLVQQNPLSSNVQCIFCKEGYFLINGICTPKSAILNVNSLRGCSENTQYVDLDNTCKKILPNCKFFDYGSKKCVFCQNGRTFINGTCKKDIHKNCLEFSNKNPDRCQTCKQKYYLNQDFQCISFPPFCQQMSRTKCVKCIDTFLFTSNFLCVDPNCFQINQFTGQCNQCKASYVKDIQGICIFIDPNCQYKQKEICLKCKENFRPNNSTGICEFVDPNCATFSSKNICLQCNPRFYYNINAQRCLKLSDNCLWASDRGQCKQCVPGFVLTTNLQCMKTNSLPNCKITDSKSQNLCFQCQIGYFLNLRGSCEILPPFCLDFDASKNQCKSCDLTRSRLEDGMCKDRNCQYLDFDGTCLGCFSGYEYGPRGQCKPIEKDPNCKQFLYDQCKRCSEGFYFDKDWKCVAVSSLCKQYDENSGLCTSCYNGYVLSEEPQGDCIIGDQIFNPCRKMDNRTGDCSQCVKGYELAKTDTKKIVCTKSDSNFVNSCLQFKNKKCSKCMTGRFLNKDGQCEQIDPKCLKFDLTTGQCFNCSDGYVLKRIMKLDSNLTKEVCLLKTSNDPNCKSFQNNVCIQCYPGYQISPQKNICQLFNDFCQTRNIQTGKCLTCFMGYKLLDGVCFLEATSSSKVEQDKILPLGCQISSQMNANECALCSWGYVNINGKCQKKDENCKKFKSETSLECEECYGGYQVLPNNGRVCVVETKIDKNCVQYDSDLNCVSCKLGYKLVLSGFQNNVICESMVSDLMCIKFNIQTGRCQECLPNMIVIQNGKCDHPTYGYDPNCLIYQNKICVQCKDNYFLNNAFLCSLKL